MTTVDPSETVAVPPRRKRFGRTLLLAALSAGIVVLSIFLGVLPPIAGFAALAVLLTALFWAIRAHLPSILLVFVAVMLAGVVTTRRLPKVLPDRIEANEGTQLARKWAASGRFDHGLPIVLHLVFDEMMSVGAMTADLPNGPGMRESLLGLGEKHSLRTYDSVYSRYFFSGDSLPNMMTPEYHGRTSLADVVEKHQSVQRANAYFEDMSARGYRTVVFQTSLMNFCVNKNVDMCESFDSFDPGGAGAVGLDARNQRASLWQTFLRSYQPSYTSQLGQTILGSVYGLKTSSVGVDGVADRYDAQRFPAWFDRFARFAATVPRGSHVFAHFMVPHSPYLLSSSCVVSGEFKGGYFLSKYPLSERAAKRQRFYEGYFAQVGCVQQKLDALLSTVEQSENFRDAVIIIHGDHGSRISSGDVVEDYTQRDFIDNYGTYFAVRAPGVAPGVDCEFTSLPEVFRRHVGREGLAPLRSEAALPVIVTSRSAGNAKVEATMPLFGCAATAGAAR